MPVRKTADDYHDLAKQVGYEWLGEEAKNSHSRSAWKCDQGHVFQGIYNHIRGGHKCPICALSNLGKEKAHTEEAYRIVGTSRGIKWLGDDTPRNSKTLTEWECANGHRWRTSYNVINAGKGCLVCSGKKPKTVADYRTLALQRGFQLIGDIPANAKTKTSWRCASGHEFVSTYSKLAYGIGCQFCSPTKPLTLTDYLDLAFVRNFDYLGVAAVRSHLASEWRCPNGHIWRASYHSIRQGSGCPHCIDMVNGAMVSKPQRAICQIVGGELNVPVGKYRIDIGVVDDGLKLAIEYDCWHWHKDHLIDDEQRIDFLIISGWRVFRIKANRLMPLTKDIRKGIQQLRKGSLYAELAMPDWGQD